MFGSKPAHSRTKQESHHVNEMLANSGLAQEGRINSFDVSTISFYKGTPAELSRFAETKAITSGYCTTSCPPLHYQAFSTTYIMRTRKCLSVEALQLQKASGSLVRVEHLTSKSQLYSSRINCPNCVNSPVKGYLCAFLNPPPVHVLISRPLLFSL